MRRLDSRTVELTDEEVAARDEVEVIIDEGHGKLEAVAALIQRHGRKLSVEFYSFLADGFWPDDMIERMISERR